MADDVLSALNAGAKAMRIDFDTSAGDETYTILKATLPMTKGLLASLAPRLPEGGTLRVFFPDEGTAALMQRDWKLGTNETMIPDNVAFSGMHRETLLPSDSGCLVR